MSKIRFSFLKSQCDKISVIPYQPFVAERGAMGFKFEPEKERLSLWCFPTDERNVSVTEVKVKGYETKHIYHREENDIRNDVKKSDTEFEVPCDAKESIDIEMSNDNWNTIKQMADSCGFDYEILG